MKRIRQRWKDLLQQMKEVVTDDDLRKDLIFRCFVTIMGGASFFMTIVNIVTAKYLLMWSTLIFAIACALNLWLPRLGEKWKKVAYQAFFAESSILCAFFCISGTPEGFSALWICFVPSFSLAVLGVRKGSMVAGIDFLVVIFLFWTPVGKSLLQYEYTASFLLRFPMIYVAFYAMDLFLEIIREQTRVQLVEAKGQYQYLYNHDALTGLYNRYGFNERLDALYREPHSGPVTMMILDLDVFKRVNDTYGHDAGDQVLCYVADLLRRRAGETGVACRWGGEEFTLLMTDLEDPQGLAETICRELREARIQVGKQTIRITVSIGVCAAEDCASVSPAILVNTADKCLYEAKSAGRDRVSARRL